jgi:hypothetical protein
MIEGRTRAGARSSPGRPRDATGSMRRGSGPWSAGFVPGPRYAAAAVAQFVPVPTATSFATASDGRDTSIGLVKKPVCKPLGRRERSDIGGSPSPVGNQSGRATQTFVGQDHNLTVFADQRSFLGILITPMRERKWVFFDFRRRELRRRRMAGRTAPSESPPRAPPARTPPATRPPPARPSAPARHGSGAASPRAGRASPP